MMFQVKTEFGEKRVYERPPLSLTEARPSNLFTEGNGDVCQTIFSLISTPFSDNNF